MICEGAGSPTEINLRDGDFTNMGLARHAGLPAIVVGDIDRGGVFAALFGTVALLAPEDQALIGGFVINKFRGDAGLLQPGLDMITATTGRPVHGVLPFHPDVWLDAEDSLAYGRVLGRPAAPHGTEWLRVAVVRLPRISNATDAEALAAEPGVRVLLTVEPGDLADADLVVLPGSKATVNDLEWLRRTGLAGAVAAHAAAGKPVLGVCGGFQMLAEKISRRGGERPRRGRRASACCRWASRSGRARSWPGRGVPAWARRCAATRSITVRVPRRAGAAAPATPTAGPRVRSPGTSAARIGTARSSPTSSAGAS